MFQFSMCRSQLCGWEQSGVHRVTCPRCGSGTRVLLSSAENDEDLVVALRHWRSGSLDCNVAGCDGAVAVDSNGNRIASIWWPLDFWGNAS